MQDTGRDLPSLWNTNLPPLQFPDSPFSYFSRDYTFTLLNKTPAAWNCSMSLDWILSFGRTRTEISPFHQGYPHPPCIMKTLLPYLLLTKAVYHSNLDTWVNNLFPLLSRSFWDLLCILRVLEFPQDKVTILPWLLRQKPMSNSSVLSGKPKG